MREYKEQLDKVMKARTRLITRRPFWAVLALRQEYRIKPGIGTAATNGPVVWFDPDFVDSLSLEELETVEAHEAFHPALGHHTRRNVGRWRDPEVWNVAGDNAINHVLIEDGFKMPESGIPEARFKGEATEGIFRTLWGERPQESEDGDQVQGEGDQGQESGGAGDGDQADQGQDGQGGPESGDSDSGSEGTGEGDSGTPGASSGDDSDDSQDNGSGGGEPDGPVTDPMGCGGVIDAEPDTEAGETMEDLQRDWDSAVLGAAAAAKAAGNVPRGMERIIEELLNPTIPWKEVLADFLISNAPDDYAILPSDRRFLPFNTYLPAMGAGGMGPLVVQCDASGSVSEEQYKASSTELAEILAILRPEVCHVVYHTRIVTHVETYYRDEAFELHSAVTGGTDFRPGYEWIEENCPEAVCCVHFTDCYGSFPEREPGFPVLFVIPPDSDAVPWGARSTVLDV